MKTKISRFEFAIMEVASPDEANDYEPRTEQEELNLRQKKLLTQVINLSIHNARNWIPVANVDGKDYEKAASNNCWLKFDDGSEIRYRDEWGFAEVTHYSHT